MRLRMEPGKREECSRRLVVDDRTEAAHGRVSRDELYELMVESASDFAIYTIDQVGTATSWNIGAERLFGYTETEMVRTAGM
jgi:PAS domain-containing protein